MIQSTKNKRMAFAPCKATGVWIFNAPNIMKVKFVLNILYQVDDLLTWNMPFPSSPKSLLQSESKCKIFVRIISSNFNMNENRFS